MSESVYRQPEVRPKRHADLRATAIATSSYFVLPLLMGLAMMPAYFTPWRVDVACHASNGRCDLRTDHLFGALSDTVTVDLNGTGDVRTTQRGKSRYLEIDGPRLQRTPDTFGGGDPLVVDTLRKFRAEDAASRTDRAGTYDGAFLPYLAFAGGLVAWFFSFVLLVARVRIYVESDDEQMNIAIWRWPLGPRRFIFATSEITGADVRRIARRTSKGGTAYTRTIDLRMRTGDEDLFPRGLPDSEKVDRLAEALDRFVRFEQMDNPSPLA